MKNHLAIKELYNILKEKDWTSFCPEKSRHELLDKWTEKWIVEAETSQDVLNFKYLSSEYTDAIKYKLTQDILEQVSEECTVYTTTDKKVSASLMTIRRRGKK